MRKLKRPLCVFDIETTDVSIMTAKIVSLSITRIEVDGNMESKTRLINPTIPIPEKSTEIHGITDEMVKDEPKFASIAKGLHGFMKDCDVGGFNVIKFDLPILIEEFFRCGIEFPDWKLNIVDAYSIFAKKERRDLVGAYKFFCDKELVDAHSAEADCQATVDVIMAQMEHYEDLGEMSMDEINDFCFGVEEGTVADLAGRIVINENGEHLFNFGKHKGEKIKDNISYAQWMLDTSFPAQTKKLLKEIIK
jgi:DNA polymerase III subunit epsilon